MKGSSLFKLFAKQPSTGTSGTEGDGVIELTAEQTAEVMDKASKYDALIKEQEETKIRLEEENKAKAEKEELTSLCTVLGLTDLDKVTDFKTALTALAENKKTAAGIFAAQTTNTIPHLAPQTEMPPAEKPETNVKTNPELINEQIKITMKEKNCTASEALNLVQTTHADLFKRFVPFSDDAA